VAINQVNGPVTNTAAVGHGNFGDSISAASKIDTVTNNGSANGTGSAGINANAGPIPGNVSHGHAGGSSTTKSRSAIAGTDGVLNGNAPGSNTAKSASANTGNDKAVAGRRHTGNSYFSSVPKIHGGSQQHFNGQKPAANNGADHTARNGSAAAGGKSTTAYYPAADQYASAPVLIAVGFLPDFNGTAAKSFAMPSSLPVTSSALLKPAAAVKSVKGKTKGAAKPAGIDWGIFIGANTSGSFTPKSQNSNFYGSSPVDLYPGLFLSFKLNDNLAINPEFKVFSPQTISATYSHANQSKVDSNQSLSVTASRKIYSLAVPLYVAYKTGFGVTFKAGPVLNFPLKQVAATSLLQPSAIKTDSIYYAKLQSLLNGTDYEKSINIGLSVGVAEQFKRWIFEAGYLKSLSGYRVSSGLGSAVSHSGSLQFSIGFQLDKVKPYPLTP
jgi:hypothetical protein